MKYAIQLLQSELDDATNSANYMRTLITRNECGDHPVPQRSEVLARACGEQERIVIELRAAITILRDAQ